MQKTTQRSNRAYKIAYWSDVQRIYYTATLTAFMHRWALILLSLLIPSAVTVLQFLAALNRSSKIGYAGCAVAYSLLAQQIALSTGRKCSVRTLERGLTALRVLGLISLHWYSRADQTIKNGSSEHTIRGAKKVLTREGWRNQQIRIITLTDLAISLWDRRFSKKGSDIIPHFAPFLTHAKLAARSQYDLVDKPTKIKDKSTSDSSTSSIRTDLDDCGKSTCMTLDVSCGEHRTPVADTDPATNYVESVVEPTTNPSEKNSSKGGRVEVLENDESALPHRIPHPTCRDRQKKCAKKAKTRGCSTLPPVLPFDRPAKLILLRAIHESLRNHSTYDADTVYSRAEWELSPDYPFSSTIVPWGYWLDRFPKLSPRERKYHVYRNILPLLKSAHVPVPDEKRITEIKDDYSSDRIPDNSFLARLYNKFVKGS